MRLLCYRGFKMWVIVVIVWILAIFYHMCIISFRSITQNFKNSQNSYFSKTDMSALQVPIELQGYLPSNIQIQQHDSNLEDYKNELKLKIFKILQDQEILMEELVDKEIEDAFVNFGRGFKEIEEVTEAPVNKEEEKLPDNKVPKDTLEILNFLKEQFQKSNQKSNNLEMTKEDELEEKLLETINEIKSTARTVTKRAYEIIDDDRNLEEVNTEISEVDIEEVLNGDVKKKPGSPSVGEPFYPDQEVIKTAFLENETVHTSQKKEESDVDQVTEEAPEDYHRRILAEYEAEQKSKKKNTDQNDDDENDSSENEKKKEKTPKKSDLELLLEKLQNVPKVSMHSDVQHEQAVPKFEAPKASDIQEDGPKRIVSPGPNLLNPDYGAINVSDSERYRHTYPPNKFIPIEKYNNVCPFEYSPNSYSLHEDLAKIEPLLKNVRKDHFLVNVSPFGPNNQLRGFRDTLMLSIYLNRTIVIPQFFKHRSDPSVNIPGYVYQDGQQKIDAERLARFTSVTTLDHFAAECHNGLDVMFLARKHSVEDELRHLATFEKISRINILRKGGNPRIDGYVYAPTVINIAKFGPGTLKRGHSDNGKSDEVYVSPNRFSVAMAYGPKSKDSNDGKCAMWLEPYRNMQFARHVAIWNTKFTSFSNDTEEILGKPDEISARMMEATIRSKSVRNAAQDYIKQIMQQPDDLVNEITNENQNPDNLQNYKPISYAAMHWRYDDKDFGKHCSKFKGGNMVCAMVKNADPEIIGKNMAKLIEDTLADKEWLLAQKDAIREDAEDIDWDSDAGKRKKRTLNQRVPQLNSKILYIAAPPQQDKVIEQIKESMLPLGIRVYYGRTLREFLKNRHKDCPNRILNDQIHDFLSQVEMELCSKSDLFIYSKSSSWSLNIIMERQARRVSHFDIPNDMLMKEQPGGGDFEDELMGGENNGVFEDNNR